jgi:hypothetical protein
VAALKSKPKQRRLFLPERPRGSISWELRAKWATREEVVLSLSERCNPKRLEGTVDRVAPSGAFVIVAGWHVPMEDVLAVHTPHFSQHVR